MVYFSLGLIDLLQGRNAPTAEYWLRAFCGHAKRAAAKGQDLPPDMAIFPKFVATKFLEQGACEDTGYPP